MIRRWPIRAILSSSPRAMGRGADPARFHHVLMPHLDAAYNYARYLTRDPAVAEDVVQEAFVRAFRAIGGCRGNERAWLMAIVRNCFHDWVRENGRAGSLADTGEDWGAVDGVNIAESRVAAGELRRSIDMLPEPFRETLVLRELEQFTYQEIALTTGAPIGTVMSRLARARRLLAMLLHAEPEEAGAPTAQAGGGQAG